MTPCKAHAKTTGARCKNAPMLGQLVCRKHGGSSPQAKAKAARRLAELNAEAIMLKYAAIDPTADPGEILFDLIVHGNAAVKFFRARVAAIADDVPDDLVWGRTKEATGGKDKGVTFEAKPNAWLALLQSAERDLAANCVNALKVGLKQRELDIAARMADMLLPLLDSVVKALGHDPDAPEVAQVIQLALKAA